MSRKRRLRRLEERLTRLERVDVSYDMPPRYDVALPEPEHVADAVLVVADGWWTDEEPSDVRRGIYL